MTVNQSDSNKLRLSVPSRGLKMNGDTKKKASSRNSPFSSLRRYKENDRVRNLGSSAGSDKTISPNQQTKTLAYVQSLIQRGKNILESVSHEEKKFKAELDEISRKDVIMDKMVSGILETDYGKPEVHVSFNPSESIIPDSKGTEKETVDSIEEDESDVKNVEYDDGIEYTDNEEEEEQNYEQEYKEEDNAGLESDDAIVILTDMESEEEKEEIRSEADQDQDYANEEEIDEEEKVIHSQAENEATSYENQYPNDDAFQSYNREANDIDGMSYSVKEQPYQINMHDDYVNSLSEYSDEEDQQEHDEEQNYESNSQQDGETDEEERYGESEKITESSEEGEDEESAEETEEYDNLNSVDFSKYMKPRNFNMNIEEPRSDEFSDNVEEGDFSNLVNNNEVQNSDFQSVTPNPSFNVNQAEIESNGIEILSSEVEAENNPSEDENIDDLVQNDSNDENSSADEENGFVNYQTNEDGNSHEHPMLEPSGAFNYDEITEKENELKDFLHHIDDFRSIANEALNTIVDSNETEENHNNVVKDTGSTDLGIKDSEDHDISETFGSHDEDKFSAPPESLEEREIIEEDEEENIKPEEETLDSEIEMKENDSNKETNINEHDADTTIGNETVYFSTLESSPIKELKTGTDQPQSTQTNVDSLDDHSNEEEKYELLITDSMYSSSSEEESPEKSEPYSSAFSFNPFDSEAQMIRDVDFSEIIERKSSKNTEVPNSTLMNFDDAKDIDEEDNGNVKIPDIENDHAPEPDNEGFMENKAFSTNTHSEDNIDKETMSNNQSKDSKAFEMLDTTAHSMIAESESYPEQSHLETVGVTEPTGNVGNSADDGNETNHDDDNNFNQEQANDTVYYEVEIPAPESLVFNEVEEEDMLSSATQSAIKVLKSVTEPGLSNKNEDDESELEDIHITSPPVIASTESLPEGQDSLLVDTSKNLVSTENEYSDSPENEIKNESKIGDNYVTQQAIEQTSAELDHYVKEALQNIDEKIKIDKEEAKDQFANSSYRDNVDDRVSESEGKSITTHQVSREMSENEISESTPDLENREIRDANLSEKQELEASNEDVYQINEIKNEINTDESNHTKEQIETEVGTEKQLLDDSLSASDELVIEEFDDNPDLFSKYVTQTSRQRADIPPVNKEVDLESTVLNDKSIEQNPRKRAREEDGTSENDGVDVRGQKKLKKGNFTFGIKSLYAVAKQFFSRMELEDLIDESEVNAVVLEKSSPPDLSSEAQPESLEITKESDEQNDNDNSINSGRSLSNKSSSPVESKDGSISEIKEDNREEVLQHLKLLKRLSEGLTLANNTVNIDDTQIMDVEDDADIIETDSSIELDLSTKIIDHEKSFNDLEEQSPNSLVQNIDGKLSETYKAIAKDDENSGIIEYNASNSGGMENEILPSINSSFVKTSKETKTESEYPVKTSTPELKEEDDMNTKSEHSSVENSNRGSISHIFNEQPKDKPEGHAVELPSNIEDEYDQKDASAEAFTTAIEKVSSTDDEYKNVVEEEEDNDKYENVLDKVENPVPEGSNGSVNEKTLVKEDDGTKQNNSILEQDHVVKEEAPNTTRDHISKENEDKKDNDITDEDIVKKEEDDTEDKAVFPEADLRDSKEIDETSNLDDTPKKHEYDEPIAVRVHNEIESEKSTPTKVKLEHTDEEKQEEAGSDVENKRSRKRKISEQELDNEEKKESKKEEKPAKKKKRASKNKKTVSITNSPKHIKTKKSKKNKKEGTPEKNNSNKKTLRSTRRMYTRSQKK